MIIRLYTMIALLSCYPPRVENYDPCHFGPHKYVLLEVSDKMVLVKDPKTKKEHFELRSMEIHQCVKPCCGWRDTAYWKKDLML